MPYFDELVGRTKIQTTSKNSQRYYTTKSLIKDLLSNTLKLLCPCGRVLRIFIHVYAWQKYAKRNGIGVRNQANWLVSSKETCLTSPLEYKYSVIFVPIWALYVLYEVKCSWIIKLVIHYSMIDDSIIIRVRFSSLALIRI